VTPVLSLDLSVVIVSWNVCALLRDCLKSVTGAQWDRPQSATSSVDSAQPEGLVFSNDTPKTDRRSLTTEVIVVDNGSSDGSVEMVRSEFPQVTLIANPENLGFPTGNNQGITAAQGRYVMLLNPDTKVLGDAFPTLVHYMDAHPDVGLVGPQLLYPDGQVQSSRRRFPTLGTLFFESTWLAPLAPSSLLDRYYVLDQLDNAVLDVDWVTGAAMLARREAVQQVGGLDEGFFMYSEELDWCRRIKGAGWRVVYLPTARIVHYVGKSSEQAVAARHINFQRSKIRYARKYHSRRIAALLRLYLFGLYTSQLGFELFKGAAGHKRALRWQRARVYWQVLKSGL
jgi:N-acetylglucosaminyl-diphospho-decaprenol L-rhamnosyltransferase